MSTIYGVDLSDVNGETFSKAKFSPSIKFVGVKVSEGAAYKDKKFIANIDAIRASGVVPIFYLFWHPTDSPQAQADEFLSRGIDWTKPGLWAIDAENGQWDAWVEENQAVAQARLRQLIGLLQSATKRTKGVLYTYKGWWVPTFGNPHSFTDMLLWDANYSTHIMAPFGGWTKPDIWQFSQNGDAQMPHPTTPGDVDWDIWEDGEERLNSLSTNSIQNNG